MYSERVFTKVQIILPKKLETEEKLALMQADAEFEVGSDGDACIKKQTYGAVKHFVGFIFSYALLQVSYRQSVAIVMQVVF